MKDFNKIYNDFYSSVAMWVNTKVNNKEDAEELIQDIFVKVASNLDNYDENQSAMSTWIMSITRNTIIDYYRKNSSENVVISLDGDAEEDLGYEAISKDYNPLAALMNSEALERVKSAIKNLPDGYRHIASLFYISDFSYKEIVEQTGLPEGTVKTKLRRTRDLLSSLRLSI